jgi:hypothetical protein
MDKKTDYGLITIVESDGSLSREEKMEFISLARLFEENNFRENLQLTSLELDEKLHTNQPSLWQKFLNHTSVKNFIDSYLYEDMDKRTMTALGSGSFKEASKALKVKEVIDKKKRKDDNTNIIVMLFPPKEDYNSL